MVDESSERRQALGLRILHAIETELQKDDQFTVANYPVVREGKCEVRFFELGTYGQGVTVRFEMDLGA